jgi:hypothetical protein
MSLVPAVTDAAAGGANFDAWLLAPPLEATLPAPATPAAPLPPDDEPAPLATGQDLLARGGSPRDRVAALRTEIENAYDMNGNDLAAKVRALSVTERNELLRTLSASGIEQLTLELAQARTGNPVAYAQLRADLLDGQPPAEIARLIDAALRWDRPDNPSGQMLGQPLVADLASYIAEYGTKGQKLGLIDHLSDARGGGPAAHSESAARAVSELIQGLKHDPDAVTRALAMLGRDDRTAVALQTVRGEDAAGISSFLRMIALGRNAEQRIAMAEAFVPVAHEASGDKRKALVDGVTYNLREQMHAAGTSHRVAPQAIAAILYQELNTRGGSDAVQDRHAARIAATAPGSRERAQAIAEANADWNVVPPGRGGDITRSTTLGYAQLSVDGVVRLFGGQWNGSSYEPAPGARNFLPNVMSQEAFFRDPVGNAMRLLVNPEMAPTLVGAWSARVIDLRRGNAANDDISLAQPDLHYRYLTGSYSNGGIFKSLFGWDIGQGGTDNERTRHPSRFEPGQLSPGERDALSRRRHIENLLR